jgi:hypothetical protein
MSLVTPQQLARRAPTLELINAEVSASLTRQVALGSRLDSGCVFVAAYAGAAAAFLASRPFQPVLAGLAFAALAIATAFAILACSVRLKHDVPEPRGLFTGYVTTSRTQALAALTASRVEAFERNARCYTNKVRRWWISLAFLAAGMTLLILALASVGRQL